MNNTKNITLCDLCISKGLSSRTITRYCLLDSESNNSLGKYQSLTTINDDTEYKFKCTYLTPREGHAKMFR